MRFVDERFRIIQGPKERIDIVEITDVVTVVIHRGFVEGTDPDQVDPNRLDIIQFLNDAGQITDPVGVAVIKRSRIDLISYRFFPPGFVHVSSLKKDEHLAMLILTEFTVRSD